VLVVAEIVGELQSQPLINRGRSAGLLVFIQALLYGICLVIKKLDPDNFVLIPWDILLVELMEGVKTFAAGPVNQNETHQRLF
jgi:hypothetical protein